MASLAVLPVGIGQKWKPSGDGDPILNILGLLAVSVGLPYFLLSTTNPLLQTWYARTYKEVLPYRLFSLSNLASLIGLLAYPFFIVLLAFVWVSRKESARFPPHTYV